MKMKVKINKYIFSLFSPPFFGKTKRRLSGNSLLMSHNISYSLPMPFLICDDVRLAHRRGESLHLRSRNMQIGCGGGVVCWPWQGAVALKEQHPEMTQYHIIQNWLWLGAVNSLEEATTLIRTPAGFDHDGYKILCKPLLSGNYEITELDPANDQRAS